MNKAMLHMPLPDTVFFYNSGDYSMCQDSDLCPVPMLTHIKIWSDKHKQGDILVPQLRYMPNELYNWPWEQKAPVGGWHRQRAEGGGGTYILLHVACRTRCQLAATALTVLHWCTEIGAAC
jgi:hypothetical protein